MPSPVVWIDATPDDRGHHVFGMPLLERALRGVLEAGVDPARVEISLGPDGADPPFSPDLGDALPLHVSRANGSLGRRVADALRQADGAALLVLPADSVVDPRLLSHLAHAEGSLAFVTGDGEERAAVLRLEPGSDTWAQDAASLPELAEQALDRGSAKPFREAEFDGYVQKLRRHLPPYLSRIPDAAAAARVERFLFWSNYKGSTDFMTRYVYPPLVWALVRPLARWRVHPNWITALNWVATFGCIPLFAAGQWVPGLALAYLMSVMDSVDGKLARLTYTSSRAGDLMDHGLDIVHPPFWYIAWGYALGGGATGTLPYTVSLWMLGLYATDRIVTAIFRQRTGASIHGATPLDVRVRTFVSRRNVNLAAFTVALALDAVAGTRLALATFYAIVAWQALSLAWHGQRLVAFWGRRLR